MNQDGTTGRIIYIEHFSGLKDSPDFWIQGLSRGIPAPLYIPDKPNLAFSSGVGKDYLQDYWNSHKSEMNNVIDNFEASSKFEITPDFSQYLWSLSFTVIKPVT